MGPGAGASSMRQRKIKGVAGQEGCGKSALFMTVQPGNLCILTAHPLTDNRGDRASADRQYRETVEETVDSASCHH